MQLRSIDDLLYNTCKLPQPLLTYLHKIKEYFDFNDKKDVLLYKQTVMGAIWQYKNAQRYKHVHTVMNKEIKQHKELSNNFDFVSDVYHLFFNHYCKEEILSRHRSIGILSIKN